MGKKDAADQELCIGDHVVWARASSGSVIFSTHIVTSFNGSKVLLDGATDLRTAKQPYNLVRYRTPMRQEI